MKGAEAVILSEISSYNMRKREIKSKDKLLGASACPEIHLSVKVDLSETN